MMGRGRVFPPSSGISLRGFLFGDLPTGTREGYAHFCPVALGSGLSALPGLDGVLKKEKVLLG